MLTSTSPKMYGATPDNSRICSPRSTACSNGFNASAAAERSFAISKREWAEWSRPSSWFKHYKCAGEFGNQTGSVRSGDCVKMTSFLKATLIDSPRVMTDYGASKQRCGDSKTRMSRRCQLHRRNKQN